MTTQQAECGKVHPHPAHEYKPHLRFEKAHCPGHDRPYVPPPPTCDACEGMADLCPLHAEAEAMLEALEQLTAWAEDVGYELSLTKSIEALQLFGSDGLANIREHADNARDIIARVKGAAVNG